MAPALRLAHISDTHLARPLAPGAWNLKRVLGRINWLAVRRQQHDPARLDAAVRDLLENPPDLVLHTGDLGQLGLPDEFAAVEQALAPLSEQGIPVLLTPGNHDRYGGDPLDDEAFRDAADRLAVGVDVIGEGAVRIGETEILLLDQARPVPPLRAWGRMAEEAFGLLRARLGEPAPAGGRVVAGHYPIRMPDGARLGANRRLRGDEELLVLLESARVPAYFCGHIHEPYRLELAPGLAQFCAGSLTAHGAVFRYDITADGVRAR